MRWPLSRWIAEACRQWRWQHTALALLLAVLTVVNGGAPLLPLPEAERQYSTWWVWHVFQLALPLVFAVRVADRAVDGGVGPVLAYGLALLAAVVAGPWLGGLVAAPLLGLNVPWNPLDSLWLGLGQSPALGLGVAAYAHRRREQRALSRLRIAEIERRQQQQKLQVARLLALRARVEPQLLFDTLQRIGTLIGTSIAAADSLLADLIVMLRSMLPVEGASASTVEREFALVQAYARVTGARQMQPAQLHLHASPAAAKATLAPLVVLPTLCSLVAQSPASWQVLALRVADRLRLDITSLSPTDETVSLALQAVDQAVLRERLAEVHGDEATLQVVPGIESGAHPGLFIELPYRDDESPDR